MIVEDDEIIGTNPQTKRKRRFFGYILGRISHPSATRPWPLWILTTSGTFVVAHDKHTAAITFVCLCLGMDQNPSCPTFTSFMLCHSSSSRRGIISSDMFCLDDRSSCLQDACNNDDDDSSKHAWPKPSFSSLICVHVPWSSIASYIFVHGGVRVGTTSIEFGLKISSQQKLFQRYYLDFFFFFF